MMPIGESPESAPPQISPKEGESYWEEDAPIRTLSQPNPRWEKPIAAGPTQAGSALTFLAARFTDIWYWNSAPAVSANENRIRIFGTILHLFACWMYFRSWSLFDYMAGILTIPALMGALALTLVFFLSDLRPLRFVPAAHLALAALWLFLGLRLGFRVGNAFAYIDRAMPMALAGAAAWICATRIAVLRGGKAGVPGA